MARPVRIDPRGGPVAFYGELVEPASDSLPLKIDIWQRVRHPPPELMHGQTLKAHADADPWASVPFPGAIIGRVVTWTWDLTQLPPGAKSWRIVLDVRQGDQSVEGYPVEYAGEFDPEVAYDELKISERVVGGQVATDFSGSYQLHKTK